MRQRQGMGVFKRRMRERGAATTATAETPSAVLASTRGAPSAVLGGTREAPPSLVGAIVERAGPGEESTGRQDQGTARANVPSTVLGNLVEREGPSLGMAPVAESARPNPSVVLDSRQPNPSSVHDSTQINPASVAGGIVEREVPSPGALAVYRREAEARARGAGAGAEAARAKVREEEGDVGRMERENEAALQRMSADQLRAAQEEVFMRLSPEAVAFLRRRGEAKARRPMHASGKAHPTGAHTLHEAQQRQQQGQLEGKHLQHPEDRDPHGGRTTNGRATATSATPAVQEQPSQKADAGLGPDLERRDSDSGTSATSNLANSSLNPDGARGEQDGRASESDSSASQEGASASEQEGRCEGMEGWEGWEGEWESAVARVRVLRFDLEGRVVPRAVAEEAELAQGREGPEGLHAFVKGECTTVDGCQ